MAGVYSWSQTAASNATADATVNWAEGQAPSSVNDSARAMMASVAKFRDDISGLLTTSGSTSAYTVTTNTGSTPATPPSGMLLAFRPTGVNAAGATLSVDGGTAFPIRSMSGIAIPAGFLNSGSPYMFMFDSVAWLLVNFYAQPFEVPLGGVIPYTASVSPSTNFIFPYGQAISRTTYAGYFSIVGTAYGSGDGSTTFNVADLRDRAIFGWGAMGGTAANRITGQTGGWIGANFTANGGSETVTLSSTQIPAHNHPVNISDPGHNHSYSAVSPTQAGASGLDVNVIAGIGGNLVGGNFTGITATTTNTGGGGAHNNLPPGMSLPFLLRVL